MSGNIPASQIVQVNPAVSLPGGRDLQLNGCMVADLEALPPGAVFAFSDPASVRKFMGPGALSEEAGQLADNYFLGFENSEVKPTQMFWARWASEATRAKVVGTSVSDLGPLTAIISGTLPVSMGGLTVVLVGLDFSPAASLSAAAAILQDAMIAAAATNTFWLAATCTYDALKKAFVVGTTEAGACPISIGESTPTSKALGLDAGMLFPGVDAQTPAACMSVIEAVTTNWVTFAAVGPDFAALTNDQVLAFSRWANSKGVRYLHIFSSIDPLLLGINDASIADLIRLEGLSSTAGTWGPGIFANRADQATPILPAFLMGVAASIAYDRPDGAITTAFKSQPGIVPTCTDGTEALALEANVMNFYGRYGTSNDQFIQFYPGNMFGQYRFMDTYLNAVWFNNALQVANMAGLKAAKRVPYNDAGYTRVKAWLQDPINRARASGVIDIGITLSEAQRAELMRAAGLDIAPMLATAGVYVQVLDPAPAVRGVRGSPIVNVWYTYGGSIQRLVIASTAIL